MTFFPRAPDCAAAVRNASRGALEVCQHEYQLTGDPKSGSLLANVMYSRNDSVGASAIAMQLVHTSTRSDALQLLGFIARDRRKNDDAVTALEEARRMHRVEQRPKQIARDDKALALAQMGRGDFSEALQFADECIKEAELDGDKSTQHLCHLTAAKVLIRTGYWSMVGREFEAAKQLATTDLEHRDLEYQRGSLAQDQGEHASAIARFRTALHLNKDSGDIAWTVNTELNLAYSLAERHEFADAKHHLQNAMIVASDRKECAWVAAEIAYQSHDLASAASQTEKYFNLLGPDDSVDRDDQIDVATLRARIELERGDLESARRAAELGVKRAEQIRTAQTILELRPWVLAKWRAPYELQFAALARSGEVKAAAMAFDQWQGRTMQDALARPRLPASLDYRDMADQVTRLERWLPVASHAALARPADPEAVLSTMRGIDLLALIVAENEVWRLTAFHGAPHLALLGKLTDIQSDIDKFRGRATDAVLASTLGALFVPDDAFRQTREVLHVLVDGRLQGFPVAALRHGTTLLLEMRPIVHLLRLPESPCVQVNRSGHATVLADPDGKSQDMRAEAEQVAGLLHTASETGPAATKSALLAAAHDSVLHVAAHGAIGTNSGAVVLAGKEEVSALEISALRLAPSLVVLSACDAARSHELDSELAGSLVAGFLGAGSQQVVATLRPVSDRGAPEITTKFYRAGGVADPALALARVQRDLAKTANADWPYFAVFGPDVCTKGAPAH
ncbi:MAG TPA: CHAT domain-containing protein [Kofleriaceae bacterium]